MKLLGILKEKNKICDSCDGFILPLKNYSVSYKNQYEIDEIRQLRINFTDKEIFVVVNKPIFNHEVEKLESVLTTLDEIGIDGVLFYDLSVVSIGLKRKFNFMLVWNQTHMVTNYNTIQYYFDKGVKGALLSNEITFDEMLEIRNKVNSDIFVNLIYKPIMSFSRRKLLSNYYISSNLKKNDTELVVKEQVNNEDYIIREEEEGTSIFLNKHVNASSIVEKMINEGFNYGIIDLSCMSEEDGNECARELRSIIKNEKDNLKSIEKINSIVGDYTGFLYRKTVYKVK